MPAQLPRPIADYFTASNRFDVEAMLVPFSAAAVVRDEGRERRGRAAIRQWLEEVTSRYLATVEITDVAAASGRTIVTGRVSGNFPGSPVQLRYAFELDGGAIARLEIG